MKCHFVVGQKVAATIDFDFWFKEGDVATISAIIVDTYEAHDGVGEHVCLRFKEVEPRAGHDGFDARYFRPIVERKTDISCFKAMLNPSHTEVPA